jgi:hypothetical protein
MSLTLYQQKKKTIAEDGLSAVHLTCILELTGSNLGKDTDYTDFELVF